MRDFFTIKRNETLAFLTMQMGIEGTVINEMSEKDKCYMIWLLCVNFKIKQMNKDKKTKTELQYREQTGGFQKRTRKGNE